MSPPPRGNRARARSRAGRPMRRPSPARWRSKPVDRVMRGEGAPSPVYRGRRRLHRLAAGRPEGEIHGAAAARGANPSAPSSTPTPRSIPAEYQSQALIDLARRLAAQNGDLSKIESIDHPHQPPHPLRDRHRRQRSTKDGPKSEPRNARSFHHVHLRGRARRRRLASRTILRARACRPKKTIALRRRISTVEDPEWTRRYHSHNPEERRSAVAPS